MSLQFNFAELGQLTGELVELVHHPTHGGQIGWIVDVATAIPVQLRRMLVDEGRDVKDLKSEYGHRVQFQIELEAGERLTINWQDVEFL